MQCAHTMARDEAKCSRLLFAMFLCQHLKAFGNYTTRETRHFSATCKKTNLPAGTYSSVHNNSNNSSAVGIRIKGLGHHSNLLSANNTLVVAKIVFLPLVLPDCFFGERKSNSRWQSGLCRFAVVLFSDLSETTCRICHQQLVQLRAAATELLLKVNSIKSKPPV